MRVNNIIIIYYLFIVYTIGFNKIYFPKEKKFK